MEDLSKLRYMKRGTGHSVKSCPVRIENIPNGTIGN